MLTLQLYLGITLAALHLSGLCYSHMFWTYNEGGRTLNSGAWKVDSNNPWPGSRSKASSWHNKNGDVWLLGGYGFDSEEKPEYLNDLWHFSILDKRWYVIKPSNKPDPPMRAAASSCGVPGILLVLYGGSRGDNSVYGDTWVYIIAKNTWLKLKTKSAPPNRSEAVTWCTITHMFVFGGQNNETLLDDFWEFSLKDLTWSRLYSDENTSSVVQVKQPRGRTGSFSWAFQNHKRNSLYMFGGELLTDDLSNTVYTSEMWEFSLTSKNWSLLSGGDNPEDFPKYNNYTLHGRKSGVSWSVPNTDELWLYGGEIELPYNHNKAFIGDVWMFNTELCQWSWGGGKGTSEEERKFGSHSASYHYTPGARSGSIGWSYENRFYMFGGEIHSDDKVKYANDLWFLGSSTSLFKIPPWIPILVVFVGLFLIAILVAAGFYSRGFNNRERGNSYSLVANSDIIDS